MHDLTLNLAEKVTAHDRRAWTSDCEHCTFLTGSPFAHRKCKPGERLISHALTRLQTGWDCNNEVTNQELTAGISEFISMIIASFLQEIRLRSGNASLGRSLHTLVSILQLGWDWMNEVVTCRIKQTVSHSWFSE